MYDHKEIELIIKQARDAYSSLQMRKMDDFARTIERLVKVIQWLTGKTYK